MVSSTSRDMVAIRISRPYRNHNIAAPAKAMHIGRYGLSQTAGASLDGQAT